ncbi:MAG: hypothetical protein MUF34_31770 [Polyangiaceae bacterium]|nr:hypothetical protein [Polyangiaceae bacterium]
MIGLGCAATPRPASANSGAAEALFKEAKKLFAAGKTAEACPKFAESQRLDPSPGTLLNLAACYEKQGKTATAWAEFLRAARLASAHGQTGRSGEAKQRAAVLEARLSYLTVLVAHKVPGLVVKRNGEVLEAAQFDVRLPTDPGDYAITAEAPGRVPFRTTVLLEPERGDAKVTVPELAAEVAKVEPVPPPPPTATVLPAPSAPEAEASPRGKPIAGYVVGGIGLAALGVGATFGVMALGSHSSAEDACPEHTNCSASAIDDRDRAGTQALIANIGVAAGVVGLGVGGYLLFLAPASKKVGLGARGNTGLTLVPNPTGLTLLGRFLSPIAGLFYRFLLFARARKLP